jgi:tellurite resistance protein
MAEQPTDDAAFNTEALKLLLQVAWANDELHPKEREFIGKIGKAWRVPAAELEELLGRLETGKPLPPPDIPLLRTRPDKVLRAAEALVAADGEVDLQEEEMLAELRAILGV